MFNYKSVSSDLDKDAATKQIQIGGVEGHSTDSTTSTTVLFLMITVGKSDRVSQVSPFLRF